MKIEVTITTNEGPPGHYKGTITLTPQDVDIRRAQFSFTIVERASIERRLTVQRRDQVYIDVQGKKEEGPQALGDLREDQLALIKLMGHGLSKNLKAIEAEGGGGQPKGQQITEGFAKLGLAFEISASDTSVFEINDPIEQSHVIQMLEGES